jgi:hypothetical protein
MFSSGFTPGTPVVPGRHQCAGKQVFSPTSFSVTSADAALAFTPTPASNAIKNQTPFDPPLPHFISQLLRITQFFGARNIMYSSRKVAAEYAIPEGQRAIN